MILTCTKPYPTSIALPVNEPLTPEAATFVGVGVGVGATSVAVFEFELLVELLEVLELFELFELEELEVELLEDDVEFEVADFVAVEVVFLVVVLFCVVAAAADVVAAGAAVVTAAELFEVAELEPDNEVAAEAPEIASPLSPKCGGVTDKTAPRPPTVPPAISNTRFMPNLVFLTLEQNQ